jgi:hypothetical protein
MINNKFNILRRDLLKNLYQEEMTTNTHIPVYLNKNKDELIGNAFEETGANGGTYVLNLQEDAAHKLSAYEIDYDFDYTVLEEDENGNPLQIKVNHIYIIEKQ